MNPDSPDNPDNPDSLVPRVANLENLMQYMAETQRQLSTNQDILTILVQRQDERISHNEAEIEIMRQMLKNYDETIVVMQGQIGLLLQKLLSNS